MALPSEDELPDHAKVAASFAESLAREYAGQGFSARALLTAFAGLVAVRNRQVAMECLKTLDHALLAAGERFRALLRGSRLHEVADT